MGVAPVDKELPWDEVTKTVAQALMRHRPEATATEAYYYMLMQYLADVLWRLGYGHRALQALGAVLTASVNELRPLVVDAPATIRRDQ